SRHGARRGFARRGHERSGDARARRRAQWHRAADCRAEAEEDLDAGAAVRRGDGNAAHQPRPEDEGHPRAPGKKGQAVTRIAAVLVILLLVGVSTALAQRRFGGGGFGRRQQAIVPNAPYDGRFTFVRIRYGPDYGFASQRLPWSHDYPSGEQHFMKIVNELSSLNPHT